MDGIKHPGTGHPVISRDVCIRRRTKDGFVGRRVPQTAYLIDTLQTVIKLVVMRDALCDLF